MVPKEPAGDGMWWPRPGAPGTLGAASARPTRESPQCRAGTAPRARARGTSPMKKEEPALQMQPLQFGSIHHKNENHERKCEKAIEMAPRK